MTTPKTSPPELVHEEGFGGSTKETSITVSYLKTLSSTLMEILYNDQGDDSPFLRKHLAAPLRDRFQSNGSAVTAHSVSEHSTAIPRVNMKMVDILPDVDESGLTARTWCLKSERSSHKDLSQESVAVLYWELREDRVWVCVDFNIMSSVVGF